MLATESAGSIRSLYRHFLAGITSKFLNAFYYACSCARVDLSGFMNATARLALGLVPDNLNSQPVFLCTDDTMVSKFGKKIEDISKLFDHTAHNGSNYLNGHCFVSVMLCIPVWNKNRISYLSIPPGYRMWRKDKGSKLEPAASMIRQLMPEFRDKKNVIILCDSWYVKQNLVSIVDEYENPDLIGNAGSDSVIYDLLPAPTGRKGRPPKHGRCLPIYEDFTLSVEKIGDCFTGSRRVLTNIFGAGQVQAYVTAADKEDGTRRLFSVLFFPPAAELLRLAGKITPEQHRK